MNTPMLDRPMSPSEFEAMERMDWHARFRSDVTRLVAKAKARQFDQRFHKAGSEVVVEFPRVG